MHETDITNASPEIFISKDIRGSLLRDIEQARVGEMHPAFTTLTDRLLSGDPQKYRDDRKLGLRVEGGGMGAVVTAYALAALELLGDEVFEVDTRFAFDQVECRSAANFNTLWWLAREILKGKSTYHSHLAGPPFRNTPVLLNPLSLNLRFQHGKPMMNMPYFRELISKHATLDWQTINEWQGKFEMVATRVDRRLPKDSDRMVRFSNFKNLDDLLDAVFACSHLPFISSQYFPPKPKVYRGMHVWDGGIVDGIPVTTNESEEPCTDIIALLTLPQGLEYNPNHPTFQSVALSYMKLWDPNVAELYTEKTMREYKQRRYLQRKEIQRDGPPFVSAVMRPRGSQHVSLMEHDPAVLQRAGEEGARALFSAFGIKDLELQNILIEKMRTYTY